MVSMDILATVMMDLQAPIVRYKDIAIFNVEGEYFAIDDMCSHAEASLAEGEVFDCKIECPLHGAEFDLKTGEAVTLPATKPVATYEITVEDEVIYLEMEDNA